jgi:hypothetical protein
MTLGNKAAAVVEAGVAEDAEQRPRLAVEQHDDFLAVRELVDELEHAHHWFRRLPSARIKHLEHFQRFSGFAYGH